MKSTGLSILRAALVALFVIGLCTSCSRYGDKSAKQKASHAEGASATLTDYFPTGLNARWTYDVSIPVGSTAPISYRSVYNVGKLIEHRVPLDGAKVGADGKLKVILKLTSGPVRTKGAPRPEQRYKLAVERDDVGLYRKESTVEWAVTPWFRGQVVMEVLMTNMNLDDPKSPRTEAFRTLLFTGKPGDEFQIPAEHEKMTFIGYEMLDGHEAAHFRRTITTDVPPDVVERITRTNPRLAYAYSPIVEDVWFRKDSGLVKLIQKVSGNVTMLMVREF